MVQKCVMKRKRSFQFAPTEGTQKAVFKSRRRRQSNTIDTKFGITKVIQSLNFRSLGEGSDHKRTISTTKLFLSWLPLE